MKLLEKYPQLADYIEQMANFGNTGSVYSLIDEFEEAPAKKLNNAKASIGTNLTSDEELLLLIDNTLFGSAKDGMLLTDKNIHYKETFSDPIVIPYEKIESVTKSLKDKKMHFLVDGETKIIGYSAVSNGIAEFSFCMFIAGVLALTKAINNNIQVNDVDDFIIESRMYNLKTVGEPSQLSSFLDKHEDTIIDLAEKWGISDRVNGLLDKLEEDENWDFIIDKLYELLPTPVRLFLSRDRVKEIVLENKQGFLEKLGRGNNI